MSKMKGQALFVLGIAITSALGQPTDSPTVTLDNLGVLQGKTKWTVGNLDNVPKPYYTFRNIPYAHMVSDENRYKQATPFDETLGNVTHPYDATKTGPMCFQGTSSALELAAAMNVNLENLLMGIVEKIFETIVGLDVNSYPGIVVNYLLELVGELIGVDGLANMTLGDLLEELLDVTVSKSEECLHLAVSTPYDPSDGIAPALANLPVMFWVHGGGFSGGYGEMGNDLARLGEGVTDVVVVAINYRVGPLGFTCLETDEAAGNMGMLDMVEALRWVQNNIEKFGGDPRQVTIFGESAGAAAIGHLVLSPLAIGLFEQGIGQSGSALSPWAFDEEPDYHARLIASYAGCEWDDPDLLVACLRALPAVNVTTAYWDYVADERLEGRLGFGGSIPCAQTHGDEMFYSAENGDHPEDLMVDGHYRHLPIFFGANSHEGTYVYSEVYNGYVEPNNIENDTEFLTHQVLETILRGIDIDQEYAMSDLLYEYYFEPDQLGNLELMTPGLIDFTGVFFLKASGYAMVQYNAPRSNSYWYSLEHASEKKSMYNLIFLGSHAKYVDDPGVSHADDLLYLFDARIPLFLCDLGPLVGALVTQMSDCNLNITCVADPNGALMTEWGTCFTGELTEEEQGWSEKMVTAWTNFAAYGDPTHDANSSSLLPTLPPWSVDSPSYLAFRSDGASVQLDYPDTYNAVMLDYLYVDDDGSTDTGDDDGASANGASAALCVLAVSLILGVFQA